MKKTRTLKIRHGRVYYRGVCKGIFAPSLREHFGLSQFGKVRITIEEEGPYRFKLPLDDSLYEIHKNSEYISVVCCDVFERLFFKPDGRKSYDITVKGVE